MAAEVHDYALLGLGWAHVEAHERTWPIPDGEIAWISWPVDEFGGVSIAGPPGSSELDRRIDAGRARITIELPRDQASARATAVADAIAGMVASPQSPLPLETSVIPIARADVERGQVDLDALRASSGLLDDLLGLASLTNISAKPGVLPPVLDRLDTVLRDDDGQIRGLLPALVFWRLAVDEYAFAPEDVRWALDQPDELPPTALDRARAEQSVQNAFKAFEALLGGWPSKDQSKFERRLVDHGLNPAAHIRLPDKSDETLIERLVRLRELRGTHAAHGGQTGAAARAISWKQLVETHWTVWHCIYERVEYLHGQTS